MITLMYTMYTNASNYTPSYTHAKYVHYMKSPPSWVLTN